LANIIKRAVMGNANFATPNSTLAHHHGANEGLGLQLGGGGGANCAG
jgi:hypothetical protein